MITLESQDLKTILHTKRANLYYLEPADLIKDAAILPQAFPSFMRGDDEQQFRRNCIEALTRGESLDFVIDGLKSIAVAQTHQAQRGGERTASE